MFRGTCFLLKSMVTIIHRLLRFDLFPRPNTEREQLLMRKRFVVGFSIVLLIIEAFGLAPAGVAFAASIHRTSVAHSAGQMTPDFCQSSHAVIDGTSDSWEENCSGTYNNPLDGPALGFQANNWSGWMETDYGNGTGEYWLGFCNGYTQNGEMYTISEIYLSPTRER
jgi:hypothetical protein